ncbi:hypothetical protein C7T94_05000 [Pedobacter yulinensis]|uniref:Gliding motility protein GldL-like N-terminal domain-containing protein n=1 Tax=Pedobacter yulinensis TaxID=2126353 RepID=A0A2T3HNS1_9SPHI|nr:hypothetical protein [Pedobacter yulinensis]PST84092.1 hypothetical protein C7T94_05000 [Pedobacter yulinensis]
MRQKKKFRVTINSITSWGASVVIIGVMAKLLRWQAADTLIIAGMLTEAILFFILGFQREDDDEVITLDHTPATATTQADTRAVPVPGGSTAQPGYPVAVSSGGFGGANTSVSAPVAAEAYDSEVAAMVEKLKVMNQSFEKMAADFQALEGQAQTAQRVQFEMDKMAKNLTAINSVYRNMLSAMNMPGA